MLSAAAANAHCAFLMSQDVSRSEQRVALIIIPVTFASLRLAFCLRDAYFREPRSASSQWKSEVRRRTSGSLHQ